MTSGQQTEQVYSFKPAAHMGRNSKEPQLNLYVISADIEPGCCISWCEAARCPSTAAHAALYAAISNSWRGTAPYCSQM